MPISILNSVSLLEQIFWLPAQALLPRIWLVQGGAWQHYACAVGCVMLKCESGIQHDQPWAEDVADFVMDLF